MATAEKTQPSRAGQPLVPPEERFWKRYSPHYELPVAGATSVFAHGMVIAVLAIGGLAYLFRGGEEALRPPQMEVSPVAEGLLGGGGDGAPGLPGLPGEPRTEMGPGQPGPD